MRFKTSCTRVSKNLQKMTVIWSEQSQYFQRPVSVWKQRHIFLLLLFVGQGFYSHFLHIYLFYLPSAKCLHCMPEPYTACVRDTQVPTMKLLVSATWRDVGRRCFTRADWKDPQEETEGREPVGRRKGKKNPQCWIQTITRPPRQAFYSAIALLNNKLVKEKKNSEWFISGASWDLHRQDLAAAQSEMRKRHPDWRETDPNP